MLLKSSYNSRGKKGFCSIFTCQHPLRAAYTFLPVPASVIASVAKCSSQITRITSFCLNQLSKNPKFFCTSLLLVTPKNWGYFHTNLTQYSITSDLLAQYFKYFTTEKKTFLKVRKIISSFDSRQLMERRLNSYLALNYCHPQWLRTDEGFVGLEKVGERDTKRESNFFHLS